MKLLVYIIFTLLQIYTIKCAYYGKTSLPSMPSKSRTYEPLFSWHQISYEIVPSSDQVVYPTGKLDSIAPVQISEDFIQYNNVPMGVTRWRNKVFITMPRRRPGIPATLNYIQLDDGKRSSNIDVPLIPYPDLETNRLGVSPRRGSMHLVSVYRTTADECNRLWMIDTGLLEYPGNPQQVQPPGIVVFDLETDQIIHRYQFPESVITNRSTLASIAVDVTPGSCDETFAYIPDLAGYGLIVYDMKRQQSWRFSHNYFHHDPLAGDFNINNELQFQWDDGIFSIALSPIGADGFRTAYFHPMASTQEFAVSTKVLRNQSNAERSYHGDDFIHLGDKGARQQTSKSALDQKTGVLFYSQVHINGLACWNTNKPFTENNHVILFRDNQRFIYPSDCTIDQEGNLWVMTNTMPYFIYRNLNPENINFRVWKFDIAQLIANTNCA